MPHGRRMRRVRFFIGDVRVIIDVPEGAAAPFKALADDALTECQRDVLEVLRGAPHRLTTPKIIEALVECDKIHGDSTVAIALADLVRRGLIEASPNGTRRGYRIV